MKQKEFQCFVVALMAIGLVWVALGSLSVVSNVNAKGGDDQTCGNDFPFPNKSNPCGSNCGIELSSLPNSGFTATAGMPLLVTGTFTNLDEIHVGVCKEPNGSSSWFTATMSNDSNYYARVIIPKEANEDFSECAGSVRILAYGWNELNDDFARRQAHLICQVFLPTVIKETQ